VVLRIVMRRAVMLGAVSATAAAVALVAAHRRLESRQPADIAPPPAIEAAFVVAELFTSEGCSSCPPADDLLRRLAHEQIVPGVRVLALGEHVDYWDRLGWRDPFSSPAFSDRQSEYDARVFHTGNVYTPQLVIDGRLQQVGSDLTAVRRAIGEAARHPKAAVTVLAQADNATHVRIQVQVAPSQGVNIGGIADVIVAITEDELTSNVQRGENRGRVLKHGAVVRSLTALGSLTKLGAFAQAMSLPVAPSWIGPNIRIVAFVQERQSRRIVGAASATLDGRASNS
jgi:hypothetical protein